MLWDRIQFISQVNEQTVGRPSIFIPFGGLGSGRMPFGHSGDIVTSWETLQYLPYFSATASNVLYSYIAHDIGGHRDYGPSSLSSFPLPIAHTHKALQALLRGLWCAQVTAMTPNSTLARRRCGRDAERCLSRDPTVVTDWCCSFAKFGAFSAQLRPHAAKKPGAEAHAHLPGTKMDARFDRRAWEFEYEYFQPMREAIQVRPIATSCDLVASWLWLWLASGQGWPRACC